MADPQRVELLAFRNSPQGAGAPLIQELAIPGEAGHVVTGPWKLAQRWLIEFLTERGTLRYLPDRGTSFTGEIRSGRLRTTVDIEQAFFLAADEAAENLLAAETPDMPADERYRSVDLVSAAIRGDRVILNIVLRSLAGATQRLALPVNL